ncbi:sensor histidine kinase [candidate division KSB1 bacterium]|nr:MAG: sensor histidine kinase [candidate division KSB1 bacterium]
MVNFLLFLLKLLLKLIRISSKKQGVTVFFFLTPCANQEYAISNQQVMKRRINFIQPLLIFILMQVAWISLLGLWIYWYVSNYIIISQVGKRLVPTINASPKSQLFALIIGLFLLVLILAGFYFIFIFLTRQININRLYETFIANFTHELKSPLASIQLYLETLQRRDVPKEKQREFVDQMFADTQRLKQVIDSILDISQIEQKKKIFDLKPQPIQSTITDLIDNCMERFKLDSRSLIVKGKVKGYWLVDQAAMQMVFSNLLDNALKYSPAKKPITIRLLDETQQFCIEFIDQGVGIEKEAQKHIFQKFYRVTAPYMPDIRGTGLGLYLVKEIVKAHFGQITVRSEGLNKGTTFKLCFPMKKSLKEYKTLMGKH